jgi:hypothetical protein
MSTEAPAPTDSFWCGPIRTERTAVLTIGWAGGILMAFGAASFATLLTGEFTIQDSIGSLIVAIMLGAPGAILFFKRARAAAVVGFGSALAMSMNTTAIVVYIVLREPLDEFLVVSVAVPTTWVLISGLLWRAIRATWLLQRLRRESAKAAAPATA